MNLTPGTRLGSYDVVALIGAGGMGEVYRAHDTKLGRDVALKILPEHFATDPDRVARFRREAQALAALNHPHVAQIYGLEDASGHLALVMELVEGPTLAEVLTVGGGLQPAATSAALKTGGHGQQGLNLDDALNVARQIALALEAAHDAGIVHRDLKPANVKVSAAGKVKVLDFGLAKLADQLTSSSSLTMSPTVSLRATEAGVILGTAAYMSPEQARGRPVDRRTDIWAFGCVLYEMLTGRRTFEAGETVSDAVAAILRSEPDWSALPSDTPAHIRTLLRRCLQKDLDKRLPHIGLARLEIDDGPADVPAPSTATIALPAPVKRAWWRRALPIATAAVLAGSLTGATAWYLGRRPPDAITKFQISLPQGVGFSASTRRMVTLSPDGSEIVFAATGRLYRRSMSDVVPRTILGTENFGLVLSPAFSPDGRSVAFYAQSDLTLKRIALEGGAAVTLCRLETTPSDMSWGPGGITFGMPEGILRVSETGGTPEVLVKVGTDEAVQGPVVLPDGDHVLFTITSASQAVGNLWDVARIAVQSLKSGARKTLIEGGAAAQYVGSGHLVYALAGNLLGVRFNLRTLEVQGAPVPVVEGLRRSTAGASGTANYSVSANGSLVFVPGPQSGLFGDIDLALTDRQGIATRLKLPSGQYEYPRVSPDARRVAFHNDTGREAAIWVYDLSGSRSPQRLTFGGKDRFPIWSSDGKRVTFQSEREGDVGLWWQLADGSAAAVRLTKAEPGESHIPESWSPTTGSLLFSVKKGGTYTLWIYSLETRKATPFGSIQSVVPTTAIFAPNGRWMAYSVRASDQSSVIYVEPFPSTGARYQVPNTGSNLNAHHPLWSADGQELLYVSAVGTFWSVRVTTAPAFSFGPPVAVPRTFPVANPMTPRTFDIAPGGRIIGVYNPVADVPALNEIRVVLNWDEELKRLLP